MSLNVSKQKRNYFLNMYRNELGVALLIIVILAIALLVSPVFLTTTNLLNLLRQTAYTAIAAIGMYFVILIGGIDLSIGAIVQLIGMVSILLLTNGVNVFFTILIALIVGFVVGAINGLLITIGRLQAFIVTLVTKQIMQGIVLVVTGGASISGEIPNAFMMLGTSYIFGVPVQVIILFVVSIGAIFLMHKTVYGRRVYVTGANAYASYLAGTNVRKVKISAYIICALFATLAGILSVARIGAFQPTTTHGGATGLELNAIAAVVVGGASLTGGKGTVIGTILGALLYGILSNLFPLIGLSSYVQQLIQGFIILAAVLISVKGNKK